MFSVSDLFLSPGAKNEGCIGITSTSGKDDLSRYLREDI